MSVTSLTELIARCRSLCRPRSLEKDAELLRRFVHQREAAAFEELLERYAPLVWGVCRRMLPSEADCEDAFQATFLALVNKPSSIDPSQALGGWLHTVAVRVAHRAQSHAHRQRPQAVLPERKTPGDVADEVCSRELLRMVDEEIERLPALLRPPLILCCLEGRTRDEAAETLGCSVAAVKSRLERGRELLRRSLQRRGVQLPAAFLVLGLTTERIRAALWTKTIQSALHAPTPAIVALAEVGVSTATIGKGKLLLAALLLVASAVGVVGTLLVEKPADAPASPQRKDAAEGKRAETPYGRKDRHGDLLPDGAIARLGTVRWRHGFMVEDLAYSPDGKTIAVVGCGRDITLWNAESGKELYQFPNRGDQPIRLAFSPDGKILATADRLSRLCRLWDVASGKELRQLRGHQNNVRGAVDVAFSPDGKFIATASNDETIRLWAAANGKEQLRIDAAGQSGRLAYSPDGKWIAWTDWDGMIHLCNPATGKDQHKLSGHATRIGSIVFSSDGERLASSGNDGTIRIWDTTALKQSHVLAKDQKDNESPIAFSPDGALLASGHSDGTIRLWDVGKGTEKRSWHSGPAIVQGVAFSPDGKTLASGGRYWGAISLWDVATGREKYASQEHHGTIDSLRFSPDGRALISIGRDEGVVRWDLATNTPRQQFSWKRKGLLAVALSADSNTLATIPWGSPQKQVHLLDLQTGRRRSLLGKEDDLLHAVVFSPDGRFVAAGGGADGDEQVIRIWDVRNGKEVGQIKNIKSNIQCLWFAPDSKALAAGLWMWNDDAPSAQTLCLWDIATGKALFHLDSHARSSGSPVAFSPDGKVLASVVAGEKVSSVVHLWNTETGKELCCHTGHREWVGAVAFSPDGKLVASGACTYGPNDSSVHIWEAATGRLIHRFEGHHSCVESVAFAADGLTVASGAGDSTILLWDITRRRPDGRWHVIPLTPRQLEACWTALMNEDAAPAYDAAWALVAAPEQAVPFLSKHLSPVLRPEEKIIARLIEGLDSNDFAVRQKASEELNKLGDIITSDLRRALDGKPALEVRRRLQQLLGQTGDWTPQRLRDHRAIQALEHIATRQAREVLHTLCSGAPQALRTEEAKAALQRLSR